VSSSIVFCGEKNLTITSKSRTYITTHNKDPNKNIVRTVLGVTVIMCVSIIITTQCVIIQLKHDVSILQKIALEFAVHETTMLSLEFGMFIWKRKYNSSEKV